MAVRILQGDCRDVLRTLPDESVHCVVTSPPYWGLRDYGVDGQMGLEPSPHDFVTEMVLLFGEVRRALRSDGTLWLNLGDSYCSTDKWGGGVGGNTGKQTVADDGTVPSWAVRARKAPIAGIKPKDLMGMPWRVAFALQADGWYLRQDIIWSKPNPMPESVTDRCTKAHEYIFLLTKSARYAYDADAIREEPQSVDRRVGRSSHALVDHSPNPRKGMRSSDPERFGLTRGSTNQPCSHPLGRNKRSVWEVAASPFSEAHFATFPPALIEPCIKAGCPKGGTVLDPFGGAGTTGMVADRLGRDAILIELNPEYVAIAERRLTNDAGMFASVAAE